MVHRLLFTIVIRGGSPLPLGLLVSPSLAAATPMFLRTKFDPAQNITHLFLHLAIQNLLVLFPPESLVSMVNVAMWVKSSVSKRNYDIHARNRRKMR